MENLEELQNQLVSLENSIKEKNSEMSTLRNQVNVLRNQKRLLEKSKKEVKKKMSIITNQDSPLIALPHRRLCSTYDYGYTFVDDKIEGFSSMYSEGKIYLCKKPWFDGNKPKGRQYKNPVTMQKAYNNLVRYFEENYRLIIIDE